METDVATRLAKAFAANAATGGMGIARANADPANLPEDHAQWGYFACARFEGEVVYVGGDSAAHARARLTTELLRRAHE